MCTNAKLGSMPRRYAGLECKVCGRHVDVCGPLSARGKCRDCGLGIAVHNMICLNEHRDAPFQQWRRNMAACVGGVLLDDNREQE